MNIECPQCKTKYRLPNDKFKPSAKFRCSVCKNIFILEGENEQKLKEELSAEPFSAMDANLSFSGLALDASPDTAPEKAASAEQPAASSSEKDEDSQQKAAEKELSSASASQPANDMLVIEESRKGNGMRWLFFLAVLCMLCGGMYWAWIKTPYLDMVKPWVYENAPAALFEYLPQLKKPETPQIAVYNLLELKDVRQYQVRNNTLGTLLVIEGKVKNNFTEPCEMIQLEASLYDQYGRILVSRRQVAGSFASSQQLENLNREELDRLINNKVSIIANNFNVRFGDEVPFTILFDNIPQEATDYKVRIIDAAIVKTKGNLDQ